jgi:hypothetical protein
MTVQLYHKNCKQILNIDCSNIFEITCKSMGTTRTQLRPSTISIKQREEASTPVYKCERCGKVENMEEIVAVCDACGAIESVLKLERLFKTGLIVCPKCKEEHSGEGSRNLSKIITAISLG